jgi:hypothetical protein
MESTPIYPVPEMAKMKHKARHGLFEHGQSSGLERRANTYMAYMAHEKDTDAAWFFEACEALQRGIQTDIEAMKGDRDKAVREYEEYSSLAYSQRRFVEFRAKLECMESDIAEFPAKLVRAMCTDMMELLDRGQGSARQLMREAGIKRLEHDLMCSDHMRQWRVLYYRRAVLQYLIEIGEGSMFTDLLSGNRAARGRLMDKVPHMLGEDSPINRNTTEFIVNVLFPMKQTKRTRSLLGWCVGRRGTRTGAAMDL